MFDSSKIYKMLKPDSNPNLITTYPVIIGGTTAVPDLANGVIIVYPLSPKPVTSQSKDMVNLIDSKEVGSSKIETTYQIDIFKQNAKNINYIEIEKEALKIQEWLKSFEIEEYLASLQSEILPNYSTIRFDMNLEYNHIFLNKASFDFSIISNNSISESVNIIEDIVFDKTIILQGEKTNGI